MRSADISPSAELSTSASSSPSIAAYRELPPPLKELIDWDQQRLDVQVKYDQVTQHFSDERLGPALLKPTADGAGRTCSQWSFRGRGNPRRRSSWGHDHLNDASFEIPLPASVALISRWRIAAQACSRGSSPGGSRVQRQDPDRRTGPGQIPHSIVGRRLAYAGVDPILFPGSIRDNLVYGLRFRPLGKMRGGEAGSHRRIAEASGPAIPIENIADSGSITTAGRRKEREDLDRILIDLMERIGMGTRSICSACRPASIRSGIRNSRRAHRRSAASPARNLPVATA